MYALVDIKGRQYKAEVGSLVRVDRISMDEGATLEFNSVMMLSGDGTLQLGRPYLDGVSVLGKIEAQELGKKLKIFRYKRRKNYSRRRGNRPKYTMLRIEEIRTS